LIIEINQSGAAYLAIINRLQELNFDTADEQEFKYK